MAELEVVKHTKAVFKIMKDSKTDWKHKLKETFIEIGIIVFAITLSLWLHNWSEQNHVRQEEKEFLTGLKIDLEKDLEELKGDAKTYRFVHDGFGYFYSVAYGTPLQQDSLKKYRWILYNTTQFNSNNSRFEGLKASGKLGIIENKELLTSILELYQEDIPWLISLNADHNTYKSEKLEPAMFTHLILDKNQNGNWESAFREPKVQNLLWQFSNFKEVIGQYEKVIAKNNKILALIDKEDL
ncbi:hypothetical protein ACD591_03650 [Rufibacter glacialis]|uniref:Uncharacterized protein n=1 Tax=Rufibacter glacialis TaxID=1259555 RepID=A0A5M8QH36_9BACT|nr:hypothetical protein [Rufibacter glacialis]KAA6434461.1 hypothetical protein FOE74_09720 [Rufibacter glacialis]GGK69829.1 hypothetical protein GCM10011405_17360 [Rufibacter glacialis]